MGVFQGKARVTPRIPVSLEEQDQLPRQGTRQMARRSKVQYLCTFCEGKLTEGAAFCRGCEHPTAWASYDEKIEWELGQWEKAKVRVGAAEHVAARPAVRAAARTNGEVQGSFSPDEIVRALPVRMPKLEHYLEEDPPAKPSVAKTPEPAKRPAKATAKPAASQPAPEVKPAIHAPTPLPASQALTAELPKPGDRYFLLKIVKLLNARIGELESRIEELEADADTPRRIEA